MWRFILYLTIVGQGLCASIFDFSGFDDPFSIFSNTRATLLRQHHGRCTQTGSNTRDEGICLTRPECNLSGGTSQTSSDCLLGICCSYSKGCGQTTNKRVSYFEQQGGIIPNNCNFTVNVENSNVCQMRIDFEQFSLPPPTSLGTDELPDIPYICHDAYFQISSPIVASAPDLCGSNDGQHMYVPINGGTRSVILQILNVAGTSIPGSWNIKVTQLQCPGSHKHQKSNILRDDFPLLAPAGCLQYFTEPTGIVRNFNYDLSKSITENHYTVNMNYATCFRRDPETCGITFTVVQFQLAGDAGGTTRCLDSLFIANKDTYNEAGELQSNTYCGTILNTANQAILVNTPGPFYISFHTDNTLTAPDTEHGYVLRYNTVRNNAACFIN